MRTSNEDNPRQGQSADPADAVRSSASSASEQTKQQAMAQFNQGRDTITDEMETVAHAAKAAASDLQQNDHEGLSEYVTQMADNISSFADNLRGKNVDQLVREASDIARKNPALFIAGSVAVGFGLTRFAKASSAAEEQNFEGTSQASQTTSPYSSESAFSSTDSDETIDSQSLADDDLTSDDAEDIYPGGHRYE